VTIGYDENVSHLHHCLVVGGGAAGLSGALVLGRARQDVVVVDAGRQSNRAAHAVGGLLAQEGTSPDALYATAHEQLRQYPSVSIRRDEVVAVAADDDGFTARLAGGDELRARRILFTAGMEDVPPDLPGVAERWGGTVFHCPSCHGWEVRDGALAMLGEGDKAVHMSLLLRGWSDDVVLLGRVDADGRAKLEAAGVRIDERPVAAITGAGATIVFADGDELPRDGLLVGAPLRQRSSLAEDLGLELNEAGAVVVDAFGRTSVPGVFAAGDVAGTLAQVSAAIGDGGKAGAMIRQSLLAEEHDLPLPFGATPASASAAAAR
jgi:thioredoxin reductase